MSFRRTFTRRMATANRFDNYREIIARFDSKGACGHDIKKGQVIGYNGTHGCRCTSCWTKWKGENADASAIEAGYMPQCM